jgi:hypothetical protein
MKVITGQLTQTERKHIRAIFDAKLMQGKINRKSYFIEQNENVYTVSIVENTRGLGMIGEELRKTTTKSTFKI